jgi:hypothetical protein
MPSVMTHITGIVAVTCTEPNVSLIAVSMSRLPHVFPNVSAITLIIDNPRRTSIRLARPRK